MASFRIIREWTWIVTRELSGPINQRFQALSHLLKQLLDDRHDPAADPFTVVRESSNSGQRAGVRAPGGATTAKFLRGDQTWSNTLVGPLNVTGTLGVGEPAQSDAAILATGSVLSGTMQWGAYINQLISASATSQGVGVTAGFRTAVAAFTMTSGFGLYVLNAVKGAGSAITTLYGLYIEAQTAGATNWAIFTAGTTPSSFGGTVTSTRFLGPATGLQTTTGPTDLTMGAVADGEVLVRSGTTIIGGSLSGYDAVTDPFTLAIR